MALVEKKMAPLKDTRKPMSEIFLFVMEGMERL
jgi:hypothetical protein